jgi:hypothetical protein
LGVNWKQPLGSTGNNLIELHEDDGTEDEDEGGDEEENGVLSSTSEKRFLVVAYAAPK